MKMGIKTWLAATAVVLGLPLAANAGMFTAGDIVVEQIGAGGMNGNGGTLSSSASQVVLDEVNPSSAPGSAYVQQIDMPNAASSPNLPLTDSGSASSDGMLNLSPDGQYLTVTGYNAALGTTSVTGTSTSTNDRVIGVVNSAGAVNTSTEAAIYSGNNIRGAITNDGQSFYTAGNGTSPDKGVYYVSGGVATLINSSISADGVSIFNNTLYASTSSGGNSSIVQIGTAGSLPTTAAASTNLPGFATSSNNPHEFMFFSESGTTVAYVADDHLGLLKYAFNSGTDSWTAEGAVVHNSGSTGDNYTGLTGSISGTTVTLYATLINNGDSNGGAGGVAQLVQIVDATGTTGSISGLSPTVLETAGAGQTFAGVAFAPVAVPEPASIATVAIGLLTLGVYGAMRRRRLAAISLRA